MNQEALSEDSARGGSLVDVIRDHDGKHDVICIEAKKVFDFCFQEHRVERFFPVTGIPTGTPIVVDCQIDTQDITCREVAPRELVDPKKNKFLVCLAIRVPVMIRVMNQVTGGIVATFNQVIVIPKQVVLCVPPGTEVQCEVTGNCCCVFDEVNDQVNCVFNLCIVIKSKATVQVLVPTLGMCMPKECKTVPAGCPPMLFDDCKDCD